ncbi:MAG TPA: hypothetical protein VFZ71_05265 [Pyrinomonadaceae bacterium]
MERGEVNGNAGWSWSRGMPWIFDFPMSKENRAYVDTVFFSNAVGRPSSHRRRLGPSVTILRNSFMKTVQDPSFLREANKLDLEVVDPFSGEKVEKTVRNYLATDLKILESVARLLSGKT